jgi:hypothetical protein
MLAAVVPSLPVIVRSMTPETMPLQNANPSWTDGVTAISTAVLAVAAILGGVFGAIQLNLLRRSWRVKNTFLIVKAYTARTEHGPSPMEARALLLSLSRSRVEQSENDSPEARTLRETLQKGNRYYIILKNCFDEADDLYRRNLVDRDFFLSRLSAVMWEGAQSLRRFAPLVQSRFVDTPLIERLEKCLRPTTRNRIKTGREPSVGSRPYRPEYPRRRTPRTLTPRRRSTWSPS